MPGAVLSILCAFSHLILTDMCSRYCWFSHFAGEEAEDQRDLAIGSGDSVGGRDRRQGLHLQSLLS